VQGTGCEWLDRVYVIGLFEFPSLQMAPGSFCRLHITVTHGSLHGEPQANQPLESKPSITGLTSMLSLMSSSPSPVPVLSMSPVLSDLRLPTLVAVSNSASESSPLELSHLCALCSDQPQPAAGWTC